MVLALVAGGYHQAAVDAGLTLFANCLAQGLQTEASSVQLTISTAMLAAGQPALALPYVLNALYHATALHMDLLAAAAVVQLAEIKLSLSIEAATEARCLIEVRNSTRRWLSCA
jgi:hypothetical protein